MARILTESERRTFTQICSLRQTGVIQLMSQLLKKKYNYSTVYVTNAYIVGIGDIPVGIVAHADTVFKTPPKKDNIFYDQEKNVMWSNYGLGADDRAGIFAIMKILAEGLKPHIIITTDEEKGCLGAIKLVQKMKSFPAELKYLIQLDRRNFIDSVYYDLDHKEFENYVNSFGFKTNTGSFSDISTLAPSWGVAAVNLSIGYVEEHFETEHLYIDAMMNTIAKVINMLNDAENINKFDYIEKTYLYGYDSFLFDNSHCQFCGMKESPESLMPIKMSESPEATTMHVCIDCYTLYLKNIVHCNKCGQAYYFPKGRIPKNIDTWICKECEGNSDDNSI